MDAETEMERLAAHEVDLCDVCGELRPAPTVQLRKRGAHMVPTCAVCYARDVRFAAY